MWLPTVLALFLAAAPDLFFSQQSLDKSFGDTQVVYPSHCLKGFLVDKDFFGNDILMVYKQDVHHCQLACTQNPRCSYFSYIGKEFHCYQKYSYSQPTMTDIPGVISGYTRKGCSEEKRIKQTIVRMSLKSNSGADLNDPVLNDQMLEQIRKEFAKNGNFLLGLRWRELPNGDFFSKTSPEEVRVLMKRTSHDDAALEGWKVQEN